MQDDLFSMTDQIHLYMYNVYTRYIRADTPATPTCGIHPASNKTYIQMSGRRKQVNLQLTCNKTPLSVCTCSDLVIENKSHPASNETPLSSKYYTHVAIWS